MAKVFRMDLPPEYEPLIKKILAWFDNLKYPVWATRYFHNTRSAKKRNLEKTLIPVIKEYWHNLSASEKNQWKQAALNCGYTNYQLFVADTAYRMLNNLSYPRTPNNYYQLYVLNMKNLTPEEAVYFRLHLKDLTGPIEINVSYKQTIYIANPSKSFKITVKGFYFDGGLNILDEKTYEAPLSSTPWTNISINFNYPERRYFHFISEFLLPDIKSEVFIDNIRYIDKNGLFFKEPFNKKKKKAWRYREFYRKEGYAFYPEHHPNYFDIIYYD